MGDLCCGDPRYQSPESWTILFKHMRKEDPGGRTVDCKTDVWSMGATLFELLSGGKIPFIYRPCTISNARNYNFMEQIGQAVIEKPIEIDGHFDRISPQAEALLRMVFTKGVAERPSAAEVLKHDWFSIVGKPMSGASTARLEIKVMQGNAKAILLNAMAMKLQRDYYQECIDAFRDIDKDKSGTVSLDEFKEAAKGRLAFCESDAETIFRHFDVSGDGLLDFYDFIAATFDWRSLDRGPIERALEHLLRDLDSNGNAELEPHELNAVFQETLPKAEFREVFDSMDENGDGRVSKDELRKFLFEPSTVEKFDRLAANLSSRKFPRSSQKRVKLGLNVCACF